MLVNFFHYCYIPSSFSL